MEKKDWLLLLVGDHIEPIQLQKALFKFANETKVRSKEAYSFIPYDWGPCSFEIYDDLGKLSEGGLIEVVPSGRGWNAYALTDSGVKQVDKMRSEADSSLLHQLEEIRAWVMGRNFRQLLRDVYADYPDFASESLYTS